MFRKSLRSATFSSLLTLRTRNRLDLTSSCIHKCATYVLGGLRVNGQHWLNLVTQILQQRHNSFRLRRSQCCRMQLYLCFLQLYFVCACMLSGCDCRAVSRLRLMIFAFLCFLQYESENVVTSSTVLPQLNMSPIVSHVSNIWPASSIWQGSGAWGLTSFATTRSR